MHFCVSIILILLLFFPSKMNASGVHYAWEGTIRRFERNGLIGLENNAGEVVCSAKYTQIGLFDQNNIAIVKGNEGLGLIDINGQEIVAPQFQKIKQVQNRKFELSVKYGSYYYEKEEEKGCITSDGIKIAYHPEWDGDEYYYFTGKIMFVKKDGLWNAIAKNGEYLSKDWWQDVILFSNQGAAVKLNEQWGILDSSGALIKDYFWKGGMTESEGRVILIGEHESYTNWSHDTKTVYQGLKYGVASTTGEILVSPQYEMILPYSEGLATVRINNRYGFIDPNGAMAIVPQWEKACSFQCDRAAVYDRGQKNFIDRAGSVVIARLNDIDFDDKFHENVLRCFTPNQGIGFMNNMGSILMKPTDQYPDNDQYYIGGLSEGLIAVSKGGKYGYINTSGDMVISAKWDTADEFSSGYAFVEKNGKYGLINKKGELVVKCKWRYKHQIFQTSNGIYAIVGNQLHEWTAINTTGEIVAPVFWAW